LFDWFKTAEPVLIPAQLLTAMFGMGCTIFFSDFVKIVRHPLGVGLGVGTQWIVVPIIGQLFVWGFGLGPGWAMGILLVTVTPGGAFSNLLTFLARGHTPLSIAITLVATLGCIVSAPVLLRIFAGAHVPPDFQFPTGRIVYEVLLYLVIPLGLGMLVARYLRRRAALISKIAIWTSMVLVLAIALGALGSGKLQVARYGWAPPLLIVAFAATIHYASLELFRAVGRTDDETVAIGIEVSVRNGGVGLLLARAFFPGQPEYYQMLYTILLYTGIQLFVPLPTVIRHRLGRAPVPLHQPRPAAEPHGAAVIEPSAGKGEESGAMRSE